VKERELRAYKYQNPKMYEHVRMANNHHRRRSDERQITPHHKGTKNDENHLLKITKHEGTKTKDYSTTTHKVKDKEHGRPTHVEHHSNDHPLGGDC
jgi:hypothetical protein